MTTAPSAAQTAAAAPPLPRRTSPVADLEPVAEGVWLLRGGFKHAMNVVLIEDPEGGAMLFDADDDDNGVDEDAEEEEGEAEEEDDDEDEEDSDEDELIK